MEGVNLHEKHSALKREHPEVQNMKFLHFIFVGNFCPAGFGYSWPKSMPIHADPVPIPNTVAIPGKRFKM